MTVAELPPDTPDILRKELSDLRAYVWTIAGAVGTAHFEIVDGREVKTAWESPSHRSEWALERLRARSTAEPSPTYLRLDRETLFAAARVVTGAPPDARVYPPGDDIKERRRYGVPHSYWMVRWDNPEGGFDGGDVSTHAVVEQALVMAVLAG